MRQLALTFPIIFRFSQWKQQDYTARLAQTPEQLKAFLQPLGDAGVDIFHCSTRRFWEPEFAESELNLAGWTRQLTGKPTITVGSVGLDGSEFTSFMTNTKEIAQPASLDALLTRFNAQEFDLVAVGRALLVDPEWAQKVRDGRQDEILPFSRNALSQPFLTGRLTVRNSPHRRAFVLQGTFYRYLIIRQRLRGHDSLISTKCRLDPVSKSPDGQTV